MLDKMKQLMEIKKQAERMKRELEAAKIVLDEGRGIKVTINGAQSFQSVEINDSLMNVNTKERFEAELLRAINTAIHKSQALAAEKMKSAMNLNMPGL
ncbi:MAG TPA: YbaB/EbfC family nucleoid-associated protein [Candidatus Omnitrophota bacterium]|nr:YbaB/EbfC family nucleoid-associated protein [Candidatus Omnitrophota bacterium]HPD84209.1 YbaB/EbfC family nucleoid-associated protein [Candidatus Omnitrophota bacterium]HRZ03065.1 YbaB/EbfC family nucleoid-associated protein [Candidatus Omnitrophota bacterium]